MDRALPCSDGRENGTLEDGPLIPIFANPPFCYISDPYFQGRYKKSICSLFVINETAGFTPSSIIFKIINFLFIFSNSFFNLERTGVVVFFLSPFPNRNQCIECGCVFWSNEWLSWKWFVLREYSELVGNPHRMENVCVYVLLAILSHPQLLVSVHAPSLPLPPPLSLSLSFTHTFFLNIQQLN